MLWYVARWSNTEIPIPFNINEGLIQIYQNIFYPNRIMIVFWFWLIALIVREYINYPRKAKRCVESILTNILSHSFFSKDQGEHRVTIYRIERAGFRVFQYIWVVLIKNFRRHKQKRLLWFHIKSIPWIFSKYLFHYERRGHPFEDGTSTYFKIPRERAEAENIAPACISEGKDVFTISPLPNIRNIDLRPYTALDKIPDSELQKKVRQYMTETMTKSFNKLKSFHHHPTNIYSAILSDSQRRPWGILVFDTELEKSYKEIRDEIPFFVKTIETIIKEVHEC